MCKITDQELLAALCAFHAEHGRTPAMRDFTNASTYKKRFGSWNDALTNAGLNPNRSQDHKYHRKHTVCVCGKTFEAIIRPQKPEPKYCCRACFNKHGHHGNQHTKAVEEGRTVEISAETRAKLSASARKASETFWTTERRQIHSRYMRQTVEKYPSSYCAANVNGRVKKIYYGNSILTGKWELYTAKLLDACGITWTNQIEPIPYIWNGTTRHYFPDFYLPEYDLYIEVKGHQHQPDRDQCKWKAMGGKLAVLRAEDIAGIANGVLDFSHPVIW